MTVSIQKAALGAFGVECLILLLISFVLTHQIQRPLQQSVVQMMLVPTPKAPPKMPTVAQPPKPKPIPVPPKPKALIHQVVPKPVPKPTPRPLPKIVPHQREKPIPKPAPRPVHHKIVHRPLHQKVITHPIHPVTTKVVKTETPRPANPVRPSVTPQYRNLVRDAVQRAVVYPLAAKIAQITGKARVSFIYSHGHVSDEKILISSGAQVLDQAALSAIIRAQIPNPPADLVGKILHFVIWVRFYMVHH